MGPTQGQNGVGAALRVRSALIRAANSAARVRFRFGIVAARSPGLGAMGGGGGRLAVVVSQVSKNNLLPGWVVYVRPLGDFQITVPSGN